MTPKALIYIGLIMLNPYFILLPIGNVILDALRLEQEMDEESTSIDSLELELLELQQQELN